LGVVLCEVVQEYAQRHQGIAIVCGSTPQVGNRSFLRLDSRREVATLSGSACLGNSHTDWIRGGTGAVCKQVSQGLGVRVLRAKLAAEHLIGMAQQLNCSGSVALLKQQEAEIHLRDSS